MSSYSNLFYFSGSLEAFNVDTPPAFRQNNRLIFRDLCATQFLFVLF